ncbi:hypothetical protein GCM10022267_75570 [Lentzea roselyniae]|uniref:Glyoxalase-like domain-containing protein n=1 Tax=Lentzea roselyniae TaxID=531940 RepID=A0ABP7C616_9PSEU
MGAITPAPIRDAARWYRENMAWPVVTTSQDVQLPLGRDTVAISVPGHLGERVLHHLEQGRGRTPVIITAHEWPRAVFLADPNGAVFARSDSPETCFTSTRRTR